MKRILSFLFLMMTLSAAQAQPNGGGGADTTYLSALKKELAARFPANRTINIVFHGHSVPTGYWSKQEVHTLESYPYLLLCRLKAAYPYAVINVITTSVGGEWAEKGQERFARDVLPHRPDVVVIDYALNDLGIGLERSRAAWSNMIEQALANHLKVILVTPSPDQREAFTSEDNRLAQHAAQIRQLAAHYGVGLADPFALFQQIAQKKGSVKKYMAHVNHPNRKGHDLIAGELFQWFR